MRKAASRIRAALGAAFLLAAGIALVPRDELLSQTYPGNAPCLNLTSPAFGGLGNNSLDNATPLGNALGALTGTGGCIFIPPGKYKFNSAPVFNIPAGIFSVGIVGGGQDSTILTWPSAGGGLTFNYNGIGSSVHFRDLSLTTGTTTGGSAVTLSIAGTVSNPAVFAGSDFYRVTMRGDDGYAATNYWTTGVNVISVSNINFDALAVYGSSALNGQGLALAGTASAIGVQYNVAKSTLQSLATGINYGTQIQGVSVDQTNFTSTKNGIATAGGLTNLAQLSVSNSQFNTVNSTSGTAVLTATPIAGVSLTNNLFLVNGTTPVGVSLATASYSTITGNVFWNSAGSTASAIGMSVASTGGTPAIISNNVFQGFNGTSAIGLNLGASASNVAATGNEFTSNTTNIVNAGSSNYIASNPGFNPVGTSSGAYAPATTATYTAGASPETDYLTGGTVTAVKIPNNAGTTICTGTPCTLDLGPNETFSVTYTGAPTQTKSIH